MNSVARLFATLMAFFSLPLGATTLEFTQAELQDRVSPQFPMQRNLLGTTLSFSDPVVVLSETENRIGIELTVHVALGDNVQGKGRGYADGTLIYKPDTAQLVLKEPRLRKLHVDGIADNYQDRVRETIDWVMRSSLTEIAVYQLNDKDLREKMAKRVLKSMEVKQGKLIVELELF